MISLHVNGKTHLVEASPDTPLLYVLRNDLGLNGPKFGCGLGQCGACTVLMDGSADRSGVDSVEMETLLPAYSILGGQPWFAASFTNNLPISDASRCQTSCPP